MKIVDLAFGKIPKRSRINIWLVLINFIYLLIKNYIFADKDNILSILFKLM